MQVLNKVSTMGASPCHLAIDPEDRFLYVSNYCSGNVAVIELLADGRLGNVTQLLNHSAQYSEDCDAAHVHEVVLEGGRVFVNDLGLDSIFQYNRLPLTGELVAPLAPIAVPAAVKMATGSGPRHLAVHPYLDFAFLVSELDSTVTSLAYTKHTSKALSVLSVVSSLPPGASSIEMGAAEIQVSNDGLFVYVSNRDISAAPNMNRSSIAVFSVSPRSGTLTQVQTVSSLGEHPRHFSLVSGAHGAESSADQHYLLVANKDSDNVVSFLRDAQTGLLSPQGQPFYSPYITQPTQLLLVDLPVL
jgi:6-phosphogluconolactonase